MLSHIEQAIAKLGAVRSLDRNEADSVKAHANELLSSAVREARAEQLVADLLVRKAALDEAESRYAEVIRHAPLFHRSTEEAWRKELTASKMRLIDCVKEMVDLAAKTNSALSNVLNLAASMSAAGINSDILEAIKLADSWGAKNRQHRFNVAAGRAEQQINELLAILPSIPGEWTKPAGQLLVLALALLAGSMAHFGHVHGAGWISFMEPSDLPRVVTSGPMLIAALILFLATLPFGALIRSLIGSSAAKMTCIFRPREASIPDQEKPTAVG